jgi:UDP-N-acetylglucosamine 2-epimerase (non-hydrolysing)
MIKVLVVMGTRPEAIKLAPVISSLRRRREIFRTKVCATGQHRELLDQIVNHFKITIDYALDIMKEAQSLPSLTSALVTGLDSVCKDFDPNLVLVQGDTTSAFTGALCAYYRQIRVGHVEAGLRTYEKYAPFPEEMNRSLIGQIADHHFAPTPNAKMALMREGIPESKILVTGNTVIDALNMTLAGLKEMPSSLSQLGPVLSNGNKVVLITGHRRENFGAGFENICRAVRALSRRFQDHEFVYPVHLNPNVQRPVYNILGSLNNVHLVQPLGYVPFVWLMKSCKMILTDSGGIQEEALSLGKPVIVMRSVTERTEGVVAGVSVLVGTDEEMIVQTVSKLLTGKNKWNGTNLVTNPYGDGLASERIADYLSCVE